MELKAQAQVITDATGNPGRANHMSNKDAKDYDKLEDALLSIYSNPPPNRDAKSPKLTAFVD